MSGHLPECDVFLTISQASKYRICICDRLRTCEQRVTERWESLRGWGESYAYKTGSDNGFDVGYAAGLDAAEAAVAEIENDPDAQVDYDRDYTADPSGSTRNPRIWLRSAIDAIRALKVKP